MAEPTFHELARNCINTERGIELVASNSPLARSAFGPEAVLAVSGEQIEQWVESPAVSAIVDNTPMPPFFAHKPWWEEALAVGLAEWMDQEDMVDLVVDHLVRTEKIRTIATGIAQSAGFARWAGKTDESAVLAPLLDALAARSDLTSWFETIEYRGGVTG